MLHGFHGLSLIQLVSLHHLNERNFCSCQLHVRFSFRINNLELTQKNQLDSYMDKIIPNTLIRGIFLVQKM